MNHTRTWTDLYGSARAAFEGRAGGHRWLVAAPPELAAALPAQLAALDGKGRVDLLVHDGVTPLLAALRELEPRGVLVVAERALAGGPETTLPGRAVEDAGGAPYREGGTFPAWRGALGSGGEEGENAVASAVASLGLPVAVAPAQDVGRTLEAWMNSTPHGR